MKRERERVTEGTDGRIRTSIRTGCAAFPGGERAEPGWGAMFCLLESYNKLFKKT